jgi:serine/threonine protein kinase
MASKEICLVDEKEVQKIAFDVCRGLTYCRRNNVLHCDVRP